MTKIIVRKYDTDHSDRDSFIDSIVSIAVKLNNDKIYRYYPPDKWWDDRQYFFILGANNREEAFEKMEEIGKEDGFTQDIKELYGE